MRTFGKLGWVKQSTCPSGSTVDSSGDQSNAHVTVCFCDPPDDRHELEYQTGVTLDVDGDTTTWTLSNPQASGNCITYDVSQLLPYSSSITFKYDGSWNSPASALDIPVRNTIVVTTLLELPRFNATSGRLDVGDWYTVRNTPVYVPDYQGIIRETPAEELIVEGGRPVQNLAAATATPVTQDITVISGNSYQIRIGRDSASGSTAVFSNAFTETLTGDGVDPQGIGTAKTATSTTLTVTITGAVTDLQVEDVTNNADPDIPSEYISVGVGGSTGYAVYNTENGNSVDVNGVVTDAVGSAISPAPKWMHYPAATNYFLNSESPVTQTISMIPAGDVTVWLEGTGSIVLSGDATGTVTEGSPVSFTGTGANLTCTVSGTVDLAQVENSAIVTPFIPTTTVAVTRAIEQIRHQVAGAFDGDEGSLYMEIKLPIDTDDLAGVYASNKYFAVNGNTGSGLVAYRNLPHGSTIYSYDNNSISKLAGFTNIVAGASFPIRVSWSVGNNARYIGVDSEFDVPSVTHQGFTSTLIEVMREADFPAEIASISVVDTYLTTDEHEARWP